MATTAELYGLKKTIVRELQDLRMWRTMGDTAAVEKCSAEIDNQLDRLRRYTAATAQVQGTAS